MGAHYMSIQVADTSAGQIKEGLQAFNAAHRAGLSAYIGERLGRWTALYPFVSAEMDAFAKFLSARTAGVVLALGSFDEDDFFCNVCNLGKDLGYFKISTGNQRKGRQRAAVLKKLDVLAPYGDAESRASLLERLCDTRKDMWSSKILDDFCMPFGIKNARCSYNYIEKNDHRDDLDVIVEMDLVTR